MTFDYILYLIEKIQQSLYFLAFEERSNFNKHGGSSKRIEGSKHPE